MPVALTLLDGLGKPSVLPRTPVSNATEGPPLTESDESVTSAATASSTVVSTSSATSAATTSSTVVSTNSATSAATTSSTVISTSSATSASTDFTSDPMTNTKTAIPTTTTSAYSNMTSNSVASPSYSFSQSPSPVLPSSSAPPSSPPAPHPPRVGAIAGGTVGGFVVLASFGFIAFLCLARRRRNRIAPSAAYRAAYGTTPLPTFPRAQSTPPSHHFLSSQGSDSFFVSRSRNTIFDGHRSSVAF